MNQTVIMESYSGLGFDILRERDVIVDCENPVEDFDIYKFIKNGTVILSIYSGNHPDFDANKTNNKPRVYTQSGANVTSFEWDKAKNQYSRELLMDMKTKFPRYLHIWYSNINQSQKEVADKMILSLKKGPGKGCFKP